MSLHGPHQKPYAQVVLCTRALGWFQGPYHPSDSPTLILPSDSAPSASTPLTQPPFTLPLRFRPCPLRTGGGEGGEQCNNVTLPHCSPNP